MAYDKDACSRLCEKAPDFTENGVTDEICASLQNDTGLNPSLPVLQTNCEAVGDALDCLVGRMDDLLERYDNCQWKEFMHELIPNLYETMKAMLCSECGLWTDDHDHEERLHTAEGDIDSLNNSVGSLDTAVKEAQEKADCSYQSTVNLIGAIDASVGAQSFVRYFRDNSGTGAGYEWPLVSGANHTLDIYMDADGDDAGSQEADRDYVVIASNCLNFHWAKRAEVNEVYYSSGDTRTLTEILLRQAMHPSITLPASVEDWSWNLTNSTIVRKGEHLKCTLTVGKAEGDAAADFRIHQVVCTWIPISPAGGIDTSDVMAC